MCMTRKIRKSIYNINHIFKQRVFNLEFIRLYLFLFESRVGKSQQDRTLIEEEGKDALGCDDENSLFLVIDRTSYIFVCVG
jgi:hypothetical protein